MANLEKPVPRNFAPEDVIPEAVALSVGSVAGFFVGRMLSPSVLVATVASLIGAAVGALTLWARREPALARNPKPDRISEVVCYLSEHLGPEMTAFVGGAENPAVVSGWISGQVLPKPLERDRLRTARQAVEELAGAYSDDMIKLWFFGKNEWLEDQAPAAVLRHGCRVDDWCQLLPAAEEFAESAY